MSDPQTLIEAADGVTTITLNRPDRLNAWTPQMANEIRATVEAAGNDPDQRVIVLTGAGRGFCAGADMNALQSIESGQGGRTERREVTFRPMPGPAIGNEYEGLFAYLYDCPKPIIAAINGPCAGIGLILTLYCDLRYVADDATMTTSFAQRGLIAEHGLSWLLPRLVGEANALDLLFTARKFKGAEAARMGLVNAAMPGEELMDHVNDVAQHLATQVSPRSVAVMKRQIRRAYHQSFAEALKTADAEMEQSFSAPDFNEGVASFVERRAPAFKPI